MIADARYIAVCTECGMYYADCKRPRWTCGECHAPTRVERRED